jgi:hypothetical protein
MRCEIRDLRYEIYSNSRIGTPRWNIQLIRGNGTIDLIHTIQPLAQLRIDNVLVNLERTDIPEFGSPETRIVGHPEMQDAADLAEMESIWKHTIRGSDLPQIVRAKFRVSASRQRFLVRSRPEDSKIDGYAVGVEDNPDPVE